MASLRDMVKSISPTWLQGTVGEKYMYTLAIGGDALVEKLQQGVFAWMPGKGTPTALQYIGSDRQIPRGPNESDAGYARRLQLAFGDWQRAGSSRSVLRQIGGFLSPMTPTMRTVSSEFVSDISTWFSYASGADTEQPPTLVQAIPVNWNWDNQHLWWRTSVILYAVAPNDFIGPGPVWGAGGVLWGDSTISWGFNKPASYVESMRTILRTWKAAHAWVEWLIVSFDATLFNPGIALPSALMPDGTWGRWSHDVAGVRRPVRHASARYANGVI